MRKISINDVASFLEGNYKYYKNIFIEAPEHIQEQLAYRLSKCQDCIAAKACVVCTCPPLRKHFVTQSCNPDRFPDLMNEEDWEEFKNSEEYDD